MATLKLEQAASLHHGKDAPCSGATKGTMPSCPQQFFKICQKFRQLCRDQSQKQEVFPWKLKLEKSKDDSLHGKMSRYSFKAPSANAPRGYGTKTCRYFSSLWHSSDLFSRTFE
jgi:hypothetical protein